MPADNTHHLITAARRRGELTRAKAVQALRELERAGDSISFEAVARAAGISRSWLYTQPDISAEIRRLRHLTQPTRPTTIPPAQCATEASLQRRLEEANARIRTLTDENQRLRRQLATALGEQRAERLLAAPRRESTTIDRR